ncbi:MAG: SulP family inorganic anion transporter [Planctomycetales bacterium]|nr:SulP family inorganic anion transporter [Planctomycetales bacterium]
MKASIALTRETHPDLRGWNNLFASLVVFLVALPLSMGIAIASGAPPSAGLISAVIGGMLVGLISGSPLQVTGPAAGLVVISYDLIERLGMAQFGIILALAGLMQVLAGCLRTGLWFRAVSPAVIQGMLAGIGVIIFAAQFHVMLDEVPQAKAIDNLLAMPISLFTGLNPADVSAHHWAGLVGVTALFILFAWKPLAPGMLKLVPAPLVAVLAAAGIAAWMELPIKYVEIAPLHESISWPGWDWHQWIPSIAHLLPAATIALIASGETLLCATAVDKMHGRPKLRTNYDQELAAQGIGNFLAGLFGGLPMTGVIVRSAANVEAGGTSRWSTVLHGVWMLLLVALFPWLLAYVPTASLAAVLVYTGIKLVNFPAMKDLARFGRDQVPICVATLLLIVFTDLLTGVLVGIFLSAIGLFRYYTFFESNLERQATEGSATSWRLNLRGAALFVRLPKLAWALQKLPAQSHAVVDISELEVIDHACHDCLKSWEQQHLSGGGSVEIDWQELDEKGAWSRRFRAAEPLPAKVRS